ncbi:glycosyltransferase (plasmid) [Streptosporangium sp. CA-135522]|uniref:glycosyltransferase n=1 Tax=Streptosporangium sp. CA-135522 TaxID=3240072 RepID=UPI003D94225B
MSSLTPSGGWVVISDYPRWPSPYFAELERHTPAGFPLAFASTLDALPTHPTQPGVINVHRLKRLYRGVDGERTLAAAKTMVERLSALRDGGWRIVWTVHNLLPIDGGPPSDADWHAALGVLGVADTVLTHTCSDAAYLARLTKAPVVVAGWAGLSAPATAGPAPEPVRALVDRLRAAPYAVLIVGNLTAYKDLPNVAGAFAAHTRRARLLIAGPCRDMALVADIEAAARGSGGRVHVHPHRIPPEHVHRLYRAADVALCPYRIDGPWRFFAQVLFPGSVSTALAFGCPVIAPDLPAIGEMTAGYPARLYPADGPGQVLADAEVLPHSRDRRPMLDGNARWRAIADTYQRIFTQLTITRGSTCPTP